MEIGLSRLLHLMINYNNKKFVSVSNTKNGMVSEATMFAYSQEDDVIWADYSGGDILKGHLIGTVDADGQLDFVYHHLTQKKEIQTGKCFSTPEILQDGRIRLVEQWQWTSGDQSKGESIIEEI